MKRNRNDITWDEYMELVDSLEKEMEKQKNLKEQWDMVDEDTFNTNPNLYLEWLRDLSRTQSRITRLRKRIEEVYIRPSSPPDQSSSDDGMDAADDGGGDDDGNDVGLPDDTPSAQPAAQPDSAVDKRADMGNYVTDRMYWDTLTEPTAPWIRINPRDGTVYIDLNDVHSMVSNCNTGVPDARLNNRFGQVIASLLHGDVTDAYIRILPPSNGEPSQCFSVPSNATHNLRARLFTSLLVYLSALNVGHNSIMYNITTWGVVANIQRRLYPIDIPPSRLVSLTDVVNVFANLVDSLQELINDDDLGVHGNWYVGESGDVFIMIHSSGFILTYTVYHFAPYVVGRKWNESFRKYLDNNLPGDGLFKTVLNEDDPYCLIYMLALGVARVHNPGFLKDRGRYLFPYSITSAINYGSNSFDAKALIAHVLCPYNSSFCTDVEKRVQETYTLQEFTKLMMELEEKYLPAVYAIDMYMIDTPASKRLYPVYASMRPVADSNRIPILLLKFDIGCHFCLVTDKDRLFTATGGKIFYTCAKCKQSFFTQKMLDLHPCRDPTRQICWHWNSEGIFDDSEEIGCCFRCHLRFSNLVEYQHHVNHCFMKGRRGNRFVRLADDPVLHGTSCDSNPDPVNRVLFADFECSIDTDSGLHTFMSYGLYDDKTKVFSIGYSMEDFIHKLTEYASEVKKTKVYFHNAMGYDANFIMSYVLKASEDICRDWGIRVIMKSSTKLQKLSFTFGTQDVDEAGNKKRVKHILEIGDTFHFLTMSLDRIVSSVRKGNAEENVHVFPRFFKKFRQKYPFVTDEEIDRVLHKNLFPYKFFRDSSCLDVGIREFSQVFEPHEGNLTNFSENVTVEDLELNKKEFDYIVKTFKCQSARDYHDLYLMCDVMQITDVFLAARNTLKESHHIDLHDYMGMPSASWAAFLRFDQSLTLPLYRSTIFAEFFQKMVRGGVTSAPLRYAKADAEHSIMYLDVNGLYPFVMQKFKYPCGKFIWRNFEVLNAYEARNTEAPQFGGKKSAQAYLMDDYFPWLEQHGKGCCICVDLHLTDELKRKTDQFPFAPEHRVIKDEFFDESGELYEYLKKWSEANDGQKPQLFKGLVGTLYDKDEYTVHWKLLKWYIEHGMQVVKIHHCVEFDEGDYLAGYIRKNIELRNKRSDELGKMVYKLLGNSVYGKTFESPFNRGKYIIVRNKDSLRGIIEHDEVLSIAPIDADNCVIKLDGDEVVLDKPTYIGACVTEYAKLHMYQIFYEKLPAMFPDGVELVYTDTDSFIVKVTHKAGMTAKEIFEHMASVDPDFIGKVGGQLKSETGEDLIDEVIALRSKVYTYKTKNGKIGKRAKGTTAAAQAKLDWGAYLEALFDLRAIPASNMQFRRTQFQVHTEELMKVALSSNDGKRKIEPDGIHTHSWGYLFL